VVHVVLPPLRAHPEDLEELTAALLNDLNRKYDRAVKGVDGEVLQAFHRYDWPGNVRELRNVLERMLVTCPGGHLTVHELPRGFGHPGTAEGGDELRLRPGMTVAEAERRLIFQTLTSTQNNKTRAAELLGISLKTLHNKLKEYGAQPED
jgi:DNA-binding NtrC family response regulator